MGTKLPEVITISRRQFRAFVVQSVVAGFAILTVVILVAERLLGLPAAVAYAAGAFAATLTAYPTIAAVRSAFGLPPVFFRYVLTALVGCSAGAFAVQLVSKLL